VKAETRRKIDPKTNVPTVATLAVAFLSALLHWAMTALPAGIPAEVVGTGYTLGLALIAVVVGKIAQHFTWAADTVDGIMDAETVIADAEGRE
jgi:hypothetical protein